MEAFTGTIIPWPIDYAPYGWAFCDGSKLNIQQNVALYALIGVAFGGDGQTTFMLPDLRGRVPLGPLPPQQLGQTGGSFTATVTGAASGAVVIGPTHIPAHTHPASVALNLTGQTAVSVSTGVTGTTAVVDGAQLSVGPASGPTSAAIFLAPPATPTAPVALGGVTTTVGGSGSVTVAPNTGGAPLALTLPLQTNPVATAPPYLVQNYIICLYGIFPQRPS